MKSPDNNKTIIETSETQNTSNRFTLQPTQRNTDVTKEILESGIVLLPANDKRLGTIKYDTPHLGKHNKTKNFLIAQLPLLVQNEVEDLIMRKLPEHAGNGIQRTFKA